MQKRITKDLLTYLPGQALPALASFITVPIYTRLFSPGDFGNYAIAAATSEFLMLGLVTGFGQAIVRFFNVYQRKSGLPGYFTAIFSSVVLISVVVGAICASLLLTLRSKISPDLYPLFWAALAFFVVSAWYGTLADILRAQERSRWYSLFSIAQSYGGIIFGLIFVLLFGMGISGLIWGQTLGLFLAIIPLSKLTTFSSNIHPSSFNRSDFNQLWGFALPFTLGNIAHWSLNLSDRYVIDLYRGNYEVGLYSVANKISWRTIQLLVYLFFLVPAPIVSRLWEEQGRVATEKALSEFTRIFFLLLIPAVVGLTVIAAPLVRLLADEAYYAGYPAIWLVAVGSMALGLGDLGSIGCMVNNQTRLIARNQFLAAGGNLILTFSLVPKYGFMGAALSTLLSFVFLAVLQAISSARFLTWRWPIKSLGRVIIASAVMAGTVILIQYFVRSDTTGWLVTNLLLSVAAGGATYGLCLWGMREISPKQIRNFLSNRSSASKA